MTTNPTTYVVHPGTGTIITIDECLLVTTELTDDEDILLEAEACANDFYHLYQVLAGNVFDGYQAFGPFLDIEDACRWAEEWVTGEWVFARISRPYGEE